MPRPDKPVLFQTTMLEIDLVGQKRVAFNDFPSSWCLQLSNRATRGQIMGQKRKYRKKSDSLIIAVQLDLDTPGLKYNKWGGEQIAKRGDWLVDNNGDKYTVAEDSFAATYQFVSPGVYMRSAPVWAEIAEAAGTLKTQEGATAYKPGDYLVANREDGTDAYAITEEKFKSMYEPIDD